MHRAKITIECTKADDPEWGTTTTHEVRNLTYEKLVQFQHDLFGGLGGVIFSYSDAKVAGSAPIKEPTPTVTTYAR